MYFVNDQGIKSKILKIRIFVYNSVFITRKAHEKIHH